METKYIKIGSFGWIVGELTVLTALWVVAVCLIAVMFRGAAVLIPNYTDMFYSIGATLSGTSIMIPMLIAFGICFKDKGIWVRGN